MTQQLIRLLVIVVAAGLIWLLLTMLPLPGVFMLVAKVIMILIAIALLFDTFYPFLRTPPGG